MYHPVKGIGMPTPKYLSIEGHKDCMGTKEVGSATFLCLHPIQPKKCKDEAWKQLNELTGTDEEVDRCERTGNSFNCKI